MNLEYQKTLQQIQLLLSTTWIQYNITTAIVKLSVAQKQQKQKYYFLETNKFAGCIDFTFGF